MKLSDMPLEAFMTVRDNLIHVYPLDGPGHVLSLACWCNPKALEDEPSVIVHSDA